MQVSKWGNSLAVRLPAGVVEQAGLREGDDVEIRSVGAGALYVERKMTREGAMEELGRIQWTLPPDSQDNKFNREELYDRPERD